MKTPPRVQHPIMASMVTTTRTMPSYHGASSEFYPLELDQPINDYMGKMSHEAVRLQRSAAPGFERSPLLHNKGETGYPVVLNRPRKLSMATTVTVTPLATPTESPETRSRSSSWSSQTSDRCKDSSQYQAWRPEYGHKAPSPLKATFQQTSARQPGELFAALPNNVLALILSKLRDSHLELKSDSCSTCWMRDACAIASTSRRWHKAARLAL